MEWSISHIMRLVFCVQPAFLAISESLGFLFCMSDASCYRALFFSPVIELRFSLSPLGIPFC